MTCVVCNAGAFENDRTGGDRPISRIRRRIDARTGSAGTLFLWIVLRDRSRYGWAEYALDVR